MLHHARELLRRNVVSADTYFEARSLALCRFAGAVLPYLDHYALRMGAEIPAEIGPAALFHFHVSPTDPPATESASPLDLCLIELRDLARFVLTTELALDQPQAGPHPELAERPLKRLTPRDGPWKAEAFEEGLETWTKAISIYPAEIHPRYFCQAAVSQLARPLFARITSSAQGLTAFTEALSKAARYLIDGKELAGITLLHLASFPEAPQSGEMLKAIAGADREYGGILDFWKALFE